MTVVSQQPAARQRRLLACVCSWASLYKLSFIKDINHVSGKTPARLQSLRTELNNDASLKAGHTKARNDEAKESKKDLDREEEELAELEQVLHKRLAANNTMVAQTGGNDGIHRGAGAGQGQGVGVVIVKGCPPPKAKA